MDDEMRLRVSWDEYFLKLCQEVATRSTCLRRQVGALAVDTSTHRILGTGYNGQIPGFPHCTKATCIRIKENIPSGKQLDRCLAVHAEQNVLLMCGLAALKDATWYITNQPCVTCVKLILSSHPQRIVWQHPYPDELSFSIMDSVGFITTEDNFTQWIRADCCLKQL